MTQTLDDHKQIVRRFYAELWNNWNYGIIGEILTPDVAFHGSLGVSHEMPFAEHVLGAYRLGIVDGPTEVHKVTIARQVLREYAPYEGLFPPGHLPAVKAAAREKYAELVEHAVGNA